MNIHVENANKNIVKVAKERFNIELYDVEALQDIASRDIIKLLDYFKTQYDTETDKDVRELNLDCILYLTVFDSGEKMIAQRNRK